jgi:predicted DNA-binding protein (UPF0251 family)
MSSSALSVLIWLCGELEAIGQRGRSLLQSCGGVAANATSQSQPTISDHFSADPSAAPNPSMPGDEFPDPDGVKSKDTVLGPWGEAIPKGWSRSDLDALLSECRLVLRPVEAEAIRLVLGYGHDYRRAAEALHTSASTVWNRVHQGKNKISDYMREKREEQIKLKLKFLRDNPNLRE